MKGKNNIKIILVRHGRDRDNILNILNGHRNNSLSCIGIQDAEAVAKKLMASSNQPDLVFTSPLKRAMETAAIIVTKNKYSSPIVMKELIERDFGSMTGKNISDIHKFCDPDVFETKHTNYFLKPTGGETFPQLIVRANQIIEQFHDKFDNHTILVVTHGDIGKAIVAAYYQKDWRDVLCDINLHNTSVLILSKNNTYESLRTT